jgi:hypothetical protein
VLNKSAKKALEPDEQITVKSPMAIVKDLVTKNVEDGHIIFCEDASNIVPAPCRDGEVPPEPSPSVSITISAISIDLTAISINLDVSYDDEGVVLPRG